MSVDNPETPPSPEPVRPRRRPIPDDPSALNPDQMGQMFDRIQQRCLPKGQRVRVHSPRQLRLNGEIGTVVDAGPHHCYVALDSYVEAGDPDPFRFNEEELEPIYESVNEDAEDLDAPEPYMAALDYLTPLKQLGYKVWGSEYRKSFQLGEQIDGRLRIVVRPTDVRAVVTIDYTAFGEWANLQCIEADAIEVIDIVREVEQLVVTSNTASELAGKLIKRDFPTSTQVTKPDYLLNLFGESAMQPEDPDDPQPYFQELQRHADVINAFRAHGVKMARRMSPTRKYYEMFWIPTAVSDATYDIFIEPDGEGWAVSAKGNKEFEHPLHGSFVEEFDIDSTWQIQSKNPDEIAVEVDTILDELSGYTGPDEPTPSERDWDDLDENVDDFDYDRYAKDSANYNIVMLITAKDMRKIVREAGFKVTSIYRSRRHHGWTVSAVPSTGHAMEVFRSNPYHMSPYLLDRLRFGLIERFPELGKITRGMYVLDQKLVVRCWEWSGINSAEPENPNNWIVYADVLPIDYDKRGLGGKMLENTDPDEIKDLSAYLRDTPDSVAAIKEAGYVYASDAVGRLRWQKYWPLPQPLKRDQKWAPIWTHFWGCPDPWGQYVYGIVSGRRPVHNDSRTGSINVTPIKRNVGKENADYATSVRRVLLKVEAMVKAMPDTDSPNEMWNFIYRRMEQIASEVNAEANPTWDDPVDMANHIQLPPVDEAVDPDPDDPQAFVNRARVAKMGELVDITCPKCGDKRQLFKNWPDQDGWGVECDKCGGYIPLVNMVVENEDEDIDAPSFIRTTFDPVEYLKENGWVLHSETNYKYYAKTFPTPRPYQLGGMVFTGIQIRIGVERSLFNTVAVMVYFVDDKDNGFGVQGYDLRRQQLYPWDDESGSHHAPDNYFDNGMAIRRFVREIKQVLANVKWPESRTAALLANNAVKVEMDRFIKELNQQAEVPVYNQRPVDEAEDPDDPSMVLQSHPGFHFQSTSHMGEKVYVKGPGEDKSDWPMPIGYVLQGPEPDPPYVRRRWYVIDVRGVPQHRLDEIGFGVHKHANLRTFDTKEDAATAMWVVVQRLPKQTGLFAGRPHLPKQ